VIAPKARLCLIRHGETDWNVEGRLQGQKDIHLNAKGRIQAARNGVALSAFLAEIDQSPEDFEWMASPLLRAIDTMEILRGEMGLETAGYRKDPLLKELSFGDWEGFTLDELRHKDPAGRAARKQDKWHFVPPGGESYEMLSARIEPWLSDLARDTICVAHGGITRVVRGLLEGLPSAEIPTLNIPQDRIYVWDGHAARWI
jgi:broad specificity phosphatase PhoE